MNRDFQEMKRKLFEEEGSLKIPKQRYLETIQLKEDLQKYKEFKEQQIFVNKRDRLLRNGWRHGILGVENTDDPGTDIYKEVQAKRNYQNTEIDHINGRRYKSTIFININFLLFLIRTSEIWRCFKLS